MSKFEAQEKAARARAQLAKKLAIFRKKAADAKLKRRKYEVAITKLKIWERMYTRRADELQRQMKG